MNTRFTEKKETSGQQSCACSIHQNNRLPLQNFIYQASTVTMVGEIRTHTHDKVREKKCEKAE